MWIEKCRAEGWLFLGVSIHHLDNDQRGIPLNDSAPISDDEVWQGHSIFEVEDEAPQALRYTDHIPQQYAHLPADTWPSSFEKQGDILMVKFEQDEYKEVIAKAMLDHFHNIRLVCADDGVQGDFRVRELTIIAARDGSTSTQTTVREHGIDIQTNPGVAYYSSRLSHEREVTSACIEALVTKKQRKVVVADLYAGVGPSFGLLFQRNLLSGYIANDLNPEAVELLRINIEHFSRRSDPMSPTMVCCEDARTLAQSEVLKQSVDVLLVNLPHDSIAHLPHLFSCLVVDQTSLIRGWAILDRDELHNLSERLVSVCNDAGATVEAIEIHDVKGYSLAKVFASYTMEVCVRSNR
jgi:tRNA G37 N-methylase Trm5